MNILLFSCGKGVCESFSTNPRFRSSPRFYDLLKHLAGTLGLLIPVALVLGAVLNVGAQNTGGLSTQLNSSVAISDFDGDLWPDVAVVQLGRSYASAADYWILVRLSTAASQAIRIVATAGGLQIAARDVNGDRITDIVLTTKGAGSQSRFY